MIKNENLIYIPLWLSAFNWIFCSVLKKYQRPWYFFFLLSSFFLSSCSWKVLLMKKKFVFRMFDLIKVKFDFILFFWIRLKDFSFFRNSIEFKFIKHDFFSRCEIYWKKFKQILMYLDGDSILEMLTTEIFSFGSVARMSLTYFWRSGFWDFWSFLVALWPLCLLLPAKSHSEKVLFKSNPHRCFSNRVSCT